MKDLIALDAVGALDERERRELEAALEAADEAARLDAARTYDAAAAAAWLAPPSTPDASVRDRLLARVKAPGFLFVRAEDPGWRPHPEIAGLDVKVLSLDPERGVITMLLRAKPGTRYPGHHHSGAEECYLLSGDLTVGGCRMKPGDFHHADANTTHGALYTETGAMALIVAAAEDYL